MAGLVDSPLKGGFNQTGGAYFVVVSSVADQDILGWSGGSGSGGSFNVGTLAAFSTVYGAGAQAANLNYSTLFKAGRVLKDMGKTIVSSGRTFRKYQAVITTATNSSPTFGVGGGPSGAGLPSNAGYFTAYLEVGRDGANFGAVLARTQ